MKRVAAAFFMILAIPIIFVLFFLFPGEQAAFSTMSEYYLDKYEKIKVSGMSDYAQYDYDMLYNRAHTVAIVTPAEALSTENSYGISADGDRYYNAHSVRTFQVAEYFKNEHNYGETIEIAEKCVLLEDGTIVMEENCYPMEMGHSYLIFLINSGYGHPLSISANNGYFDLNLLSLNDYKIVLIHALYGLNLIETNSRSRAATSETFETLEEAETVYGSADAGFAPLDASMSWETISIDTEYTDSGYELKLYYDDTGDETYYKCGEFIYKG